MRRLLTRYAAIAMIFFGVTAAADKPLLFLNKAFDTKDSKSGPPCGRRAWAISLREPSLRAENRVTDDPYAVYSSCYGCKCVHREGNASGVATASRLSLIGFLPLGFGRHGMNFAQIRSGAL